MKYLVTWEIDIEADSPKAAADQAFEIMQRNNTSATVFIVKDKDTSKSILVDLLDEGDKPNSIEMIKVGAGNKYDFYVGERNGEKFYNIVPKGNVAPNGGYPNSDYIVKVKGLSFNPFKSL